MSARTERELNSIADLLLTGPVECPPGAEASSPFPISASRDRADAVDESIELLMHGRVPGFPTAWMSQYASNQRGADTPSYLLRISSDVTECESFGERGSLPADDFAPLLDGAVLGSCRLAIASQGAKPDELCAMASSIQRWTILTGADEQSVVTCYQLLKMLLTRGEAVRPRAGAGIVFVGCDEAAARAAFERLHQATQKHLGLTLRAAGVIPKIEPIPERQSARYRVTMPWERIRRACFADPTEKQAEPTVAATPNAVDRAATADTPRMETIPNSNADLASFLPDGLALEARDPKRPEVELALDSAGRLHACLRTDPSRSVEATILRLLAAVRWAVENRKLLALTRRDRKFDETACPVAHLFTDNPAAILAICDVAFEGELRLHLLKKIGGGAEARVVHEWIA